MNIKMGKLVKNIHLYNTTYVDKMWQIFNEIVENQDLYRKKDGFFFTNCLKDFIFYKYIFKMWNERFPK